VPNRLLAKYHPIDERLFYRCRVQGRVGCPGTRASAPALFVHATKGPASGLRRQLNRQHGLNIRTEAASGVKPCPRAPRISVTASAHSLAPLAPSAFTCFPGFPSAGALASSSIDFHKPPKSSVLLQILSYLPRCLPRLLQPTFLHRDLPTTPSLTSACTSTRYRELDFGSFEKE
jgi:hypothetical protein